MNKLVGVVIVALGLVVSGCNITPQQAQVISQNAGTYSAVIWLATDNPTTNQILEVKTVLDTIKVKSSSVLVGQSFAAVLYPDLVALINTNIPAQDGPLAKAAALTLLNGLDTLFAMHPEWQTTSSQILSVVNAYVSGAQLGLGMNENSLVMKRARANANLRKTIK